MRVRSDSQTPQIAKSVPTDDARRRTNYIKNKPDREPPESDATSSQTGTRPVQPSAPNPAQPSADASQHSSRPPPRSRFLVEEPRPPRRSLTTNTLEGIRCFCSIPWSTIRPRLHVRYLATIIAAALVVMVVFLVTFLTVTRRPKAESSGQDKQSVTTMWIGPTAGAPPSALGSAQDAGVGNASVVAGAAAMTSIAGGFVRWRG